MFRVAIVMMLVVAWMHPANANSLPFTCEVNGKLVEMIPESGTSGAVSIYDEEAPQIRYDPAWLTAESFEHQAFILAHECAHIILKHSRRQSYSFGMTPSLSRDLIQREREADCLGAIILRHKAHFTSSQIASVAETIERDPRMKVGAGITHPDPRTRARTILQCSRTR